MLSFSLGPLALSISQLFFIIGLALFWGAAILLAGKGNNKKQLESLVFKSVVIFLLTARLSFVARLWQDYQSNWWQILNIRDGGFIFYFGWFAALLYILLATRGKSHLSRPLLSAAMLTLLMYAVGNAGVQHYYGEVKLPTVPMRDFEGNKVYLTRFGGHPMIVNYWASWCPPCRQEMPILAEGQQANPSIVFVFVNQGEHAERVRQFLTKQGLTLHNVFLDPASQLSQQSGVAGFPTTLFFNQQGKLVASHMGPLSKASLNNYLHKLK